jgi:ketosteroid isomerase-like protein
MSQENVEIVTAAFAAVRGDFAGILPMLTPDVVWEVRADLPDARNGRRCGRSGRTPAA